MRNVTPLGLKSAAGVAEIVEEAGFKPEVPDLIGEDYIRWLRQVDAPKALDEAIRSVNPLA